MSICLLDSLVTLIFLFEKCEKILQCKSFSHSPTKNVGIFEILLFEI